MNKSFLLPRVRHFKKALQLTITFLMIAAIALMIPADVSALYMFGNENGYHWYNSSEGAGKSSFDHTKTNGFTATWEGKGDTSVVAFGKGWKNGDRNRKIYYEGTFNPSGSGYLAVHGWTYLSSGSKYPIADYYVVESYAGDWRPSGKSITYLGRFSSDGATYECYRSTQIDELTQLGSRGSFYRYWSIRSTPKPTGSKISGTVTLKNHIKQWEKASLRFERIDSFYQVIEAAGRGICKGSCDIEYSGTIDDLVPYKQKISIQTSYTDGSRYMQVDFWSTVNPQEDSKSSDKNAQFEIEFLYYDHIDYYDYVEWVPVVALKSVSNGRYVTVKNSTNRVRADGYTITDAQKFHYFNIRGDCAFVSLYNKKGLNSTARCDSNYIFPQNGPFKIYWH